MEQVLRVLDLEPVESLAAHVAGGGGVGLDLARRVGSDAVISTIGDAGLRGRGGGGFPTATKWSAVARSISEGDGTSSTVVINAAEGEPGSFKDRAILRSNPYRVLEGAAVAALATGAPRVVIGIKETFHDERRRLDAAIDEVCAQGWFEDCDVEVVAGPDLYLFGEETALLESAEGRLPFPRVVPPYRRGLDDSPGTDDTPVPPVAANNVETLANVPGILTSGAEWFRSVGTAESPGTIVCTVTGDTVRHGVAEVPMGTSIGEIIDGIGQGPADGRKYLAAASGVANPLIPAVAFDTPASYEDLAGAGYGLGTGGFMVFDDRRDPLSVALGVARFLSVESCGQCEPCKRDGLAIAEDLDRLRTNTAGLEVVSDIEDRLRTITDGARCYLATQQYEVVESLLRHFPESVADHANRAVEPSAAVTITTISDIVDGQAVLSDVPPRRQPDWSFDESDSGEWPAARFA